MGFKPHDDNYVVFCAHLSFSFCPKNNLNLGIKTEHMTAEAEQQYM